MAPLGRSGNHGAHLFPYAPTLGKIRVQTTYKFAARRLPRKLSEYVTHPLFNLRYRPLRSSRLGQLAGLTSKHRNNSANPANREGSAVGVLKKAFSLPLFEIEIRPDHPSAHAAGTFLRECKVKRQRFARRGLYPGRTQARCATYRLPHRRRAANRSNCWPSWLYFV